MAPLRRHEVPVAILVARTDQYWWTYTLRCAGVTEATHQELFSSPEVAFKTALFELNRRGYHNGEGTTG